MRAEPWPLLHITYSLATGGLERFVLNMVTGADRDRFCVEVCALCPGGDLIPSFKDLGVPVHVVPKAPGLDPLLAMRLAALMAKRRIKIVHTHDQAPWLYGAPLARLAGVRALVHTEHASVGGRVGRAEALLARLTDRVVADSHKVARDLLALGVPAERVEVVHNGVDVGAMAKGSRERGRRAMGLDLEGHEAVVVCVARLDPVKDHVNLLRAMGSLPERAHLVLVGDGPMRGVIEATVRELGLGGRVHLLGTRRDVADILAGADLFCLASLSEGLPLTILEAMSAGRAVVATRVGGIPEVVEEGRTGLLVPPGRPAELAEALRRLLSESHTTEAMGRAGQELAWRSFSLGAMMGRYEGLYRSIMSLKGR